jgi:flagellar capping protein FliD
VTFVGNSTDTGAEALARLAETINAADAGVRARTVRDGGAGTVRLEIAAAETGAPHAFTIADVSGNLVAVTGIDATSTTAGDARFVVDGVARTSPSNDVFIDAGRVRLLLKAATGPSDGREDLGAIIAVSPDPVSRGILDLADAVNDLREFARGEGSLTSSRVRSAIDALLAARAMELEALGIAVRSRIAVDMDRLTAEIAAERSRVERVLGGGEGVATRLSLLADEGLAGSTARVLHATIGRPGAVSRDPLIAAPGAGGRGHLVDVVG